MSIGYSMKHFVMDELKRRGYEKIGKLESPKQDVDVMGRAGNVVVVHGPPRPHQGGKYRLNPQADFDAYLHKLQRSLEKLIRGLGHSGITIVFGGGGDLELPEWFMDWCREMGIRIEVLAHPEEICRVEQERAEIIHGFPKRPQPEEPYRLELIAQTKRDMAL